MTASSPGLVVLISGGGTNLQAIIDAIACKRLQANLVAVISNRPEAFGLQRAIDAGAEAVCIDHRHYADRQTFDLALAERIKSYSPALVILAGFMRILTPDFVRQFEGKLLNIHPSLLPKYAGLHTHRRALEAGDSVHGATVHFVTEELDGGPGIVQAQVPILPDDTEASLARRVLEVEHQIYPAAIQWCLDGDVLLRQGIGICHNKPLARSGILWPATPATLP